MASTVPFVKRYTSPEELVALLRGRGLGIADARKAAHYLAHIGYYRLSAYMYPLLAQPKALHRYKPGVTFRRVMTLYRFDKKLRLLLFNEIEKIEVAVRAAIVSRGCEATGDPFWLTDARHFADRQRFGRTLHMIGDELGRSREEFIAHYRETYSEPYPPAWITAEILPFGVLTNIYANLRDRKIKKRVAQSFGLQAAPFESWLTIVGLTRNICCHHARLWNRQNTLRPTLPARPAEPWIALPTDTLRIYFNICIIKYLLSTVSPGNDMGDKLRALLAAFPDVDPAAMGFPGGWESEPLWSSPTPKA